MKGNMQNRLSTSPTLSTLDIRFRDLNENYTELLKANLKDNLEDLILQIALKVYHNADNIYRQASEGLLDDDVDEVDDNEQDIIRGMIKDILK